MRNLVKNVLSAPAYSTTIGTQIDAGQLVSASFQAVFGDTTAAGTFKIQASNDNPNGQPPGGFTATNWTDVPNQTASITSGSSALLTIANMAYRWIRAVYTDTAAGIQTIVVRADVAGNLNNKYFFINSGNNTHQYYVWFNVNSAGTDPAIAGLTGVEIALATNDTAATVGAAIATALAAVASSNDFTTSGTTTVTVTNKVAGPYTPASNGLLTASPAFTFAITGGGTTTVNVSLNALSI